MPDNDWKRVNQSPAVSAVIRSCGGQGVPRVTLEGREFRIMLTPSGAEKLADRLRESAAQSRSVHARRNAHAAQEAEK